MSSFYLCIKVSGCKGKYEGCQQAKKAVDTFLTFVVD